MELKFRERGPYTRFTCIICTSITEPAAPEVCDTEEAIPALNDILKTSFVSVCGLLCFLHVCSVQ